MRYAYPALIEEEPEGVTLTFPDLPFGVTDGATVAEALDNARDLLVTVFSALVESGDPIPRPSPANGRPVVPVDPLVAAKIALHAAMRSARMSNAELGRRMGLDERAIRRLRDPLHRSHIGEVARALDVLGKRLEIVVRDAA